MTMRRAATIPVALILLGMPGAPVHAQQADSANTIASVLRRAATQRWQVRLTAVDSVVIQGRVWKIQADSALVGADKVAQANVAIVERMHRDNSGIKRGALIGGAVTSAILGTFAATLDERTDDVGMYYLVTGAVGAVIFGTMGALIAPGHASWETVWRRGSTLQPQPQP